jgi:hypothetical protein
VKIVSLLAPSNTGIAKSVVYTLNGIKEDKTKQSVNSKRLASQNWKTTTSYASLSSRNFIQKNVCNISSIMPSSSFRNANIFNA